MTRQKMSTVSLVMITFMLMVIAGPFWGISPAKAETYQEGDYTYSVSSDSAYITSYIGSGGDVLIPDTLGSYPVVGISSSAFTNRSIVKTLTIPGTVNTIASKTFSGCTELTTITFEEGVEQIADSYPIWPANCVLTSGAFQGCTKLKTINFPDSLVYIGARAFEGCTGLTTVIIGNGVKTIGGKYHSYVGGPHPAGAFTGCTNLAAVSIPYGVSEINECAFTNCSSLQSVSIPGSVERIGRYAFQGCYKLTEVMLGEGLSRIDNESFLNCPLTGLVLPESVSTIGERAFCNSYLAEVIIPQNVKEIGYQAFDQPTIVNVDSNNAFYSSQEGILYDKAKTVLKKYPSVKAGSFSIPDTVATIGDSAFSNCTLLNAISISPSVNIIGNWAFSGCNFTSVTIPGSVTDVNKGAFQACQQLQSVTISEGVETIGDMGFSGCSSLIEVSLPSSLINLKEGAFNDCLRLSKVTINSPTTCIQDSNSYYHPEVTIPGNSAIRGFYPSTAYDYATTHGNRWEEIGAVPPPPPATDNYPIIIIPGVMGSELYLDEDCTFKIWDPENGILGAQWLTNMTIEQPLHVTYPYSPCLRIGFFGNEKEYGAIKEYEALVNRLSEYCERTDREIYFFSYDWRKSNVESANKLRDFINTLNTDRVDLVCHSMGGIVACQYAANDTNLQKLNKVITLGTPYEGAPVNYNVICDWALPIDCFSNFGAGILGLTKDVKTKYPAAAELSPTLDYFSSFDFYEYSILGNQVIDYDKYVTYNEDLFGPTNSYSNAIENQERATLGAEKLCNSGKSYYGFGNGITTLQSVAFIHIPPTRVDTYDAFFGSGDGTVPILSATRMLEICSLPHNRWKAFPNLDHGGLHKESDCQDWIIDVLDGIYDSSASAGVSAPGGGNDISQLDPYIVVRIDCPGDATISLGDVLLSSATTDQLLSSDIGQLYMSGEDHDIKIFAINHDSNYKIQIDGCNEGSVDYSIRFFDTSNTKYDERIFEDVPITNQTRITTGSDNNGEMVLSIDNDGDGQEDTTWVSEGPNIPGHEATTDTTPPVITSPAEIMVEATDIETPVNLPDPIVTDASPVTITNDAPDGFPLGTTVVTWTATDSYGNSATATQNVTIVDTTSPIFEGIEDVQAEATDIETQLQLAEPDVTDASPVTFTNDAPATFPLGTTMVTWTATDSSGNSATTTQNITIVDTTLPVVTAPDDITAILTGENTPLDIGQASIEEIFPGTLTNDAPDAFPVGTTLVTWTATDANGNTGTAIQRVTVVYAYNGVQEPINSDGSSVFKTGSTIPVKFQLQDANGDFVSFANASLLYALLTGDSAGDNVAANSSGKANDGSTFRYDASSNQYIYNLKTKGFDVGVCILSIQLDDGNSYTVQISLE